MEPRLLIIYLFLKRNQLTKDLVLDYSNSLQQQRENELKLNRQIWGFVIFVLILLWIFYLTHPSSKQTLDWNTKYFSFKYWHLDQNIGSTSVNVKFCDLYSIPLIKLFGHLPWHLAKRKDGFHTSFLIVCPLTPNRFLYLAGDILSNYN